MESFEQLMTFINFCLHKLCISKRSRNNQELKQEIPLNLMIHFILEAENHFDNLTLICTSSERLRSENFDIFLFVFVTSSGYITGKNSTETFTTVKLT